MKIKDLNFDGINSDFINNLKSISDNESYLNLELTIKMDNLEELIIDLNNRNINTNNIDGIVCLMDYFGVNDIRKFLIDNSELTNSCYEISDNLPYLKESLSLPDFMTGSVFNYSSVMYLDYFLRSIIMEDSIRWFNFYYKTIDDFKKIDLVNNLFEYCLEFDAINIFKILYFTEKLNDVTSYNIEKNKNRNKYSIFSLNYKLLSNYNSIEILKFLLDSESNFPFLKLIHFMNNKYELSDLINKAINLDSVDVLKYLIEYFEISFNFKDGKSIIIAKKIETYKNFIHKQCNFISNTNHETYCDELWVKRLSLQIPPELEYNEIWNTKESYIPYQILISIFKNSNKSFTYLINNKFRIFNFSFNVNNKQLYYYCIGCCNLFVAKYIINNGFKPEKLYAHQISNFDFNHIKSIINFYLIEELDIDNSIIDLAITNFDIDSMELFIKRNYSFDKIKIDNLFESLLRDLSIHDFEFDMKRKKLEETIKFVLNEPILELEFSNETLIEYAVIIDSVELFKLSINNGSTLKQDEFLKILEEPSRIRKSNILDEIIKLKRNQSNKNKSIYVKLFEDNIYDFEITVNICPNKLKEIIDNFNFNISSIRFCNLIIEWQMSKELYSHSDFKKYRNLIRCIPIERISNYILIKNNYLLNSTIEQLVMLANDDDILIAEPKYEAESIEIDNISEGTSSFTTEYNSEHSFD